jgi:LysR family glycine cleavage system transcriptional activator
MRRRLPSLNALKAFEAAARQQSFTRAAQELCVTQGAVSQQVKALEDELGIRLFWRDRQRLALTEAGKAYLGVVRDAFDRLRAGTEQLLQREVSGALAITTSPNFAAKWLVPRLGRFAQAHPDIVLTVSASAEHIDFARSESDLAIRHGDGHWPGLHVARLCGEQLFPVCSPRLLEGARALRRPADLRQHTLLHVNGRDEWAKWLAAAAAEGVDCSRGLVLNQASMAIDAAIDGQGVALARTALASWDLLAGRLVRPFRESLDAAYAFWIVCPNSTAKLPKIAAFESWLLSEAREDTRRLVELVRPTGPLEAKSRIRAAHPRR